MTKKKKAQTPKPKKEEQLMDGLNMPFEEVMKILSQTSKPERVEKGKN